MRTVRAQILKKTEMVGIGRKEPRKWKVKSEKWKVKSEKWEVKSEEWKVENWELRVAPVETLHATSGVIFFTTMNMIDTAILFPLLT